MAVFTSQFSIATSSIGIGGLIILTVFKLLVSDEKLQIDRNLLYLFAAFILVQVISSAVCGNPSDSFDHIYRKISLYIIFIASILFIKNASHLKKMLIVFIISAGLSFWWWYTHTVFIRRPYIWQSAVQPINLLIHLVID